MGSTPTGWFRLRRTGRRSSMRRRISGTRSALPGITFTYLSVKIDDKARVLMEDGRPTANLFASGEIMAGNILGKGYCAGTGMAIGSVFGRIAGREAARHAHH